MSLSNTLIKGTLIMASVGLSAWATVGGDVTLTVLGYEPTDQNVYLLHEFWDGWGGYKLYYFDLKGKNPHKLIEAKSYYHKDKQGGTDDDPIFMAKLTHLQQRLNPLPPIAPKSAINIIINKHTTQNVPMPYDPERIITQYHHQYHLSYGKYQSPPQQATTYHRPNLTITQAYQIPKHHKVLAVIEYLDEPMETGYTTEHPLLLSPTTKKATK